MIKLYKDSDQERWDAYVLSSPLSSCYHLAGWKKVIEQAFHHKTYYFFSEDKNGQINGLLPLVHLKSLLFGSYMVSMPYFNYGGVCAPEEETRKQLLQATIDLAVDRRAKHIEFRQTFPLNNGLPVKTTKVSMQMELPDTEEKLWDGFPSKLRSQIKKPIKEGFTARIGREGDLDAFYFVFSVNMRDLGTPVYSRKFFEIILNNFSETARICTVYSKDNQPMASGVLIGFKDRLEIPWAASLREYNRFSPNMLLYGEALKFACKNGFRRFDFGRSTPGESTCKFKEQWGAKPIQLFWHYWLRNSQSLPELNPKNPKYEIAIKVWKKLPLAFTNLIGPMIVKNLP